MMKTLGPNGGMHCHEALLHSAAASRLRTVTRAVMVARRCNLCLGSLPQRPGAMSWCGSRHARPAPPGIATRAISAAEYYASQPLPSINPDGSVNNGDGSIQPPLTELGPLAEDSGLMDHLIDSISDMLGSSSSMAEEGDDAGLEGGGYGSDVESLALAAQADEGASTALAEIPDKVQVQFVVPQYVTSYGQVLKVVGALEELGAWVPDKAPAMKWHDGHSWTLDMELPVGTVSFKVVMQEESGNTRWEDGENRTIEVPATTQAASPMGGPADTVPVASVGVACPWGDTDGTTVSALPDKEFIKRKLQAVEARVAAVREKWRRMARNATGRVLTDRREGWHAAARALEGHNGAAAAPSAAAVNGQGSMLQVPIVDPSELPTIDVTGSAAGDDVESRFNKLLGEIVSGDAGKAAVGGRGGQQHQRSSIESAGSSVEEAAYDGDAVRSESLNERVLGATVDQLLAAAQEALQREEPTAAAVALGTADSEAAQAAAFLGELQAATAALEQEAGLSGRDSVTQLPATATADGVVDTALPEAEPAMEQPEQQDETLAPQASAHEPPVPEAPPASPVPQAPQPPSSLQGLVTMTFTPSAEAAMCSKTRRRWLAMVEHVLAQARHTVDGALTFTADSLSVDVDREELLRAALDRACSRTGSPVRAGSPEGDEGVDIEGMVAAAAQGAQAGMLGGAAMSGDEGVEGRGKHGDRVWDAAERAAARAGAVVAAATVVMGFSSSSGLPTARDGGNENGQEGSSVSDLLTAVEEKVAARRAAAARAAVAEAIAAQALAECLGGKGGEAERAAERAAALAAVAAALLSGSKQTPNKGGVA